MGTYHVKKTHNSQYHFVLKAANGETILASETYTTKGAAFGGISSCKENSPFDDRYVRKTDSQNRPFLVLTARNGQTIGVSEAYSSAHARDQGIASCKANGPNSPVQDDTGE